MSSEKGSQGSRGQPIEASEFQAPSSEVVQLDNQTAAGIPRRTIQSKADAPWWHSQFNLMLCVFGLLGAATLLFILITPPPATLNESTLISYAGDASRGAPRVDKADNGVAESQTPYSDAQRERARAESQDILADLLDAQNSLQQKGVLDWAKEQFEESLAVAEEGDEFYKRQEFIVAIERYQSALTSLGNISDLIPAELNRRVAAGLDAIKEGKSDLARTNFQSALEIDQNYIPALQGLDRVKSLDQVLNLLSTAETYENQFSESDQLSDIQAAIQAYQQAQDLDSQFEPANTGLRRASELEIDKQYRIAMSDGFRSLFAQRYSSARTSFNVALGHRPGDETASSALRQSLASDKRSSLKSLLSEAKRFEQGEQWANALSNYQTVLQRDENQVDARVGRILSETRLNLDNDLKRTLSDPLSLSKPINREKAQSILDDARGLSKKGPIINQQITQLESLLSQLDATVNVVITSDSATNVSLKKDGAKSIVLGRFTTKKMALKPGRYTLIGTRLGFKDVRMNLELNLDTLAKSAVQSFLISCNEQVVGAG